MLKAALPHEWRKSPDHLDRLGGRDISLSIGER